MESLRYWRELLTNVRIDTFILAYLYLVNGLISNLGKIYSHVKKKQVRKLILRSTLKSFVLLKGFETV